MTQVKDVSVETRGNMSRRSFLGGLLSTTMLLAGMAFKPELAEAAPKTIRGSYWKMTLPKFLRGKVRVSQSGTSIYQIYPRTGSMRNNPIAIIEECNAQTARFMKGYSNHACTLKLKNGKKVSMRLSEDAIYIVIYKVRPGKYLIVEAPHYGSANGVFYQQLSSSQLGSMARLQSLGKRSSYPTSMNEYYIPKACLKALCGAIKKA